jgi:hypothetical protein
VFDVYVRQRVPWHRPEDYAHMEARKVWNGKIARRPALIARCAGAADAIAAVKFARTRAIDIVLINRSELPPAGAGESPIRSVAAALANAVFDATGARLRRAPLTPPRLKPALA